MANFTVNFNRWEQAYSAQGRAWRKLSSLQEELNNVVQMLSLNETTEKYCSSVRVAATEVSGHRDYVKKLQVVLQDASALYESTDREVTQNISQVVTAKIGFSLKAVAVAQKGFSMADESISGLWMAFQQLGKNKEQAAALLNEWKTHYKNLSKEEQENIEKAVKKVLGDTFFDSLILTDMIITGKDFEEIVKKAGDSIIQDSWKQAVWNETMDYVFDEETLSKRDAMEQKLQEELLAGDYVGFLGTMGQGFADLVLVGSAESLGSVVQTQTQKLGETIGDILYDSVQAGENLGDKIYDILHDT